MSITAYPPSNASSTENWDDGTFASPSARFAAEAIGFYRPSTGVVGVNATLRTTTAQVANKYAQEIDLGTPPVTAWRYSLGFFETGSVADAEFGSFAHLTSGGNRITAFLPPGTPSNQSSGAGAFQIVPSGNVQFPFGAKIARDQHLGFTTSAPVSAGTTGVWDEVAAFRLDRTDPTSDVLKLGVPDDSATFSSELQIVAYANIADDYGQTISTHPTVRIFSDAAAGTATNQWISIHHNGTDAKIDTGTGVVDINGNVEIGANTLGFLGTGAVTKQTITGSALGNPLTWSIAQALATVGLFNNTGTA